MVVFLFVYLCFALILNANFCFRTMMMIGNSEILNLRIRLGIYFVFNVGFSVSGGCLVKVVNNAASVTRLNLSLRLHATIFKASRRAALPQLAFFAALARASESESECECEGDGEQRAGHDLPLRPGYYVICGQQLSAARARKIDDVVGEAPAPEKPPLFLVVPDFPNAAQWDNSETEIMCVIKPTLAISFARIRD